MHENRSFSARRHFLKVVADCHNGATQGPVERRPKNVGYILLLLQKQEITRQRTFSVNEENRTRSITFQEYFLIRLIVGQEPEGYMMMQQ